MGRLPVVLVVVAACSSQRGGPAIQVVDPPSGPNTAATPIHIRGTDLVLPIVSDLDDGETRVDAVTVSIGDVLLSDAMWRDPQLVDATVPQGLDVGTYDVTIKLGARGDVLAGGFEVTDGSIASDAGTDAPLVCPPTYTANAFGTFYRVVTTGQTWQNAELDCEATGGHLAVIDDATENAALPTSEHWLGYSETVTQGTFLWVTGLGSSFVGFATGEPDVIAGAFCVTTRPDGWHDDICGELKAYICECDGKPADHNTYR